MSGVEKLTSAQRKAVDAENRSVIVSAAAGAGKTTVLIERYKRLLKEGVPPEKILVITFTRKAAAQLRHRAMRILDDEEDRELAQLVPRISRAPISTIDSFCAGLIREFAAELGISPSFATLDDDGGAEMREHALTSLTSELSFDDEKLGKYQALLRLFGSGRGDEGLLTLVVELFEFLRRLPDPKLRIKEWLATYREVSRLEEFADSTWGQRYLKLLNVELFKLKKALERLEGEFTKITMPSSYLKYFPGVFNSIRDVFSVYPDLGGMNNGIQAIIWNLPPAKREAEAEKWLGKWKSFRTAFKESFREKWLVTKERLQADLSRLNEGGSLDFLVWLVNEFGRRYTRLKETARAFDFADFELYALKLLKDVADENEDVRDALKKRFSHILMDEYQDTNPLQDAILDALSRHGGADIFRVGDVKQSIYRFRHAEPELFTGRYDSSGEDASSPTRRVDLADNFRSARPIIDFVNAVFSRIMTKDFGDVDYRSGHELIYGLDKTPLPLDSADKGKSVSVRLLVSGGDTQSPDYKREMDRKKRVAALVGREILRLTNSLPPLDVFEEFPGGLRRTRLSFRHITILHSAPSTWLAEYSEVFRELGIPLYAEGKDRIEDEPVARDLISILEIVDNPVNDIPLAAVLLGPVGQISPDFLWLVKHSLDREKCLYDALKHVLERGVDRELVRKHDEGGDFIFDLDAEHERLHDVWRKIEEIRRFAECHDLGELISHVINTAGLRDIALSSDEAEGALLRIEWIEAKANELRPSSVSEFLRTIKSSERVALPASGVGDRVQLLSIHKAKGLEFPVVILAGIGSPFNFEDLDKSVLFDRKLGFGCKVLHERTNARYPTAAFRVVERRMKTKQLEEEARKLYVGMTRARERLIIAGEVSESMLRGKHLERRGTPDLPIPEREDARSFADWLIPVLFESVCFQNALGDAEIELDVEPPRGFGAEIDAEITREKQLSDWYDKRLAKETAAVSVPISRGATEEEAKGLAASAIVAGFDYRFIAATLLPSKLSATRLAEMDDPEGMAAFTAPRAEMAFSLPSLDGAGADGESGWLAAQERGIAVHILMEHLPFGKGEAIDATSELQRLVQEGILSREQADIIPLGEIESFLSTDVGGRLAGRGRAYAEWRFLSSLKPVEISASAELMQALGSDVNIQGIEVLRERDFIVLQGVVDLIFEDEQGRLILDWKTDRLAKEAVVEHARHYRLQMWAYRHAVDRALGAVDSSVLVFLSAGIIIDAAPLSF